MEVNLEAVLPRTHFCRNSPLVLKIRSGFDVQFVVPLLYLVCVVTVRRMALCGIRQLPNVHDQAGKHRARLIEFGHAEDAQCMAEPRADALKCSILDLSIGYLGLSLRVP